MQEWTLVHISGKTQHLVGENIAEIICECNWPLAEIVAALRIDY